MEPRRMSHQRNHLLMKFMVVNNEGCPKRPRVGRRGEEVKASTLRDVGSLFKKHRRHTHVRTGHRRAFAWDSYTLHLSVQHLIKSVSV